MLFLPLAASLGSPDVSEQAASQSIFDSRTMLPARRRPPTAERSPSADRKAERAQPDARSRGNEAIGRADGEADDSAQERSDRADRAHQPGRATSVPRRTKRPAIAEHQAERQRRDRKRLGHRAFHDDDPRPSCARSTPSTARSATQLTDSADTLYQLQQLTGNERTRMSDRTLFWISASRPHAALRRRRTLSRRARRARCWSAPSDLQPHLNSFVLIDESGARAARARPSEARWMKGEPLSPLDGVPTSIKDTTPVKGWPTRYGSHATDETPAAGGRAGRRPPARRRHGRSSARARRRSSAGRR